MILELRILKENKLSFTFFKPFCLNELFYKKYYNKFSSKIKYQKIKYLSYLIYICFWWIGNNTEYFFSSLLSNAQNNEGHIWIFIHLYFFYQRITNKTSEPILQAIKFLRLASETAEDNQTRLDTPRIAFLDDLHCEQEKQKSLLAYLNQ